MNKEKKTPRVYRRITPRTVALHQAQELISGNGTATVRAMHPEYNAPNVRANMIKKKTNQMGIAEYIESSLEQIGEVAIGRLGELVNSEDEKVATKNVHYAIDHIRGKAVQRNINATVKMNIQSVLD